MPNNNHPHIQALHELYQEETQAFRKVHRMIDLFESIIKTYTVVILSEYIKRNKLSDSAKGLLSQGLRTPSLGTWQLFSRVLFEELQAQSYTWSIADFPIEFVALDKALNVDKTNVIALRNGYAHGATPTDAHCEEDIKKFEPFLNQLVESKCLCTSSIEVLDNKVYLVTNEVELSLHPILVYRKEESGVSFAFFNDIKNDKIGLLNYPLSKHYREKDFYDEFHEHLPLNVWKKSGNNEFYQRIEELTETFKGRTAEREQLLRFVEDKNKGYLSIQGNPGIGKSALIAQFFKDVKANEKLKHIQVVEYFIRRGTAQAKTDYLLNYLIKRTDELFPQGREIRAEDKNTWSLQQQLFSKWRLWVEHNKENKLLFLIDGLDEGVEDDIVKYLPRENFENVLIIYGSRPGGHRSIDELWSTLPTEYHIKIELNGLSKQDIRALIYEVANKYELEKESPWIDAIEKRSQGNPLYLKLLCNAIENTSVALNDIKSIPEEIDQFYKAILQRYAQDTLDGDALLAGLYTFAAAKDYLTFSHLALINKLGEAQVERVGSTLKEVLYENPLTKDILDYQLFHESFREYLQREKALKITEASERIIDFCATWQYLEGSWEQRYCLEHYATHLNESKKDARQLELLALFQNEVYTSTQKKVLKQFDATKKLYQLSLLKAGEIKENDAQIEAALFLVDLKYEEANDAPQIVALVANNEIDLALQRIESFGGNDKEGLQRKFILYMLCLMELSLLESKEKPFRKAAIEKLLNHFDEQMPVDHSILNWNGFFPSYIMYLMACEWVEIGLDYIVVLKRTEKWNSYWFSEKGPYSSLQFRVLLECARGINNTKSKILAIKGISYELVKQGRIEEAESVIQEALTFARAIRSLNVKISELSEISTELSKQGFIEDADSVIQEALTNAREISSINKKTRALNVINLELYKQGRFEEAERVMQEALAITRNILVDEWNRTTQEKIWSNYIITELVKQERIKEIASEIQETITLPRGISNIEWKNSMLKNKVNQLAKKQECKEVTAFEMHYTIVSTNERFDNTPMEKIARFLVISTKFAKQGRMEDALSAMNKALIDARGIIIDNWKCEALSIISTEFAKQGRVEDSVSIIQEALSCARGISQADWKCEALSIISTEFAKQGLIEDAASVMQEALTNARGISSVYRKCTKLSKISTKLTKLGLIEDAASVMQEALTNARGISSVYRKSSALNLINIELSKQGNFFLAEKTGIEIIVIAERQNCWKEIAKYQYKQKGWKKSLNQFSLFKSDEARLFYLKGWSEALNLDDLDVTCLHEGLKYLVHDLESIETLLQKYAINQLFLGDATKEQINRLNKTLNIQWAIDIKAQFPSKDEIQKLSTNIEEWLHEIADEDDRDDIVDWAKRVQDGKWTEEKFQERLKEKF